MFTNREGSRSCAGRVMQLSIAAAVLLHLALFSDGAAVEPGGTKFKLFNRDTPPTGLQFSEIPWQLNSSKSLRLLLHGFGGGYETSHWLRNLATTITNLSDDNVVSVEWDAGEITWDHGIFQLYGRYKNVVAGMEAAMRPVAELVQQLRDFGGGVNIRRIHCIGFSIGAHACGLIGRDLRGQMGKITGLDPAGKVFESLGDADRLSRDDAALVEVLHTDMQPNFWAGNLISLGFPTGIGHTDYLLNGGKDQPYYFGITTDHLMALKYYSGAIEDADGDCYEVQQCDDLESAQAGACGSCSGSCPKISLDFRPRGPGERGAHSTAYFYIETNPDGPPFCSRRLDNPLYEQSGLFAKLASTVTSWFG